MQKFEEHIDKVDTLYLTKVNAYFEGDAFFPEIDKTKWKRYLAKHSKHDCNKYDLDFFMDRASEDLNIIWSSHLIIVK